MPRTLFADRFLVTPTGPEPPEPAGYDEARGISVAADGRPFIEAGAVLATRTLTEAEGEGGDDDDDRLPGIRGAESLDAQLLATRTATFVDAEEADTDEDRLAQMTLHTDTRAPSEKADAPPWAHTQTAAPGEPVDYDYVAFFGTVTQAPGESNE
jgi:hypothetical protein